MRFRRRQAPGARCRLVSVACLVEESRLVEVVTLAQAAGFSVPVSPTPQVVPGGAPPVGPRTRGTGGVAGDTWR